MKKIILSAAVAAMALTTTASALEDIKVNGQAKLWYETKDVSTNSMGSSSGSTGEAVFKLGVTGKQGNVGFGATVYQTSTMGLENGLVDNDRHASSGLGHDSNTSTNNATTSDDGEMYTGEMYITIPTIADTTLKIGKQELDTPLAFTERWNAVPNTFNAALAINSSFENTTLIAAYVGQGGRGEVSEAFHQGAYAGAALYKNDMIAANLWYYSLDSLADAVWLDATGTVGPVTITGIYAEMMPNNVNYLGLVNPKDTDAYAIKLAGKVSDINLMAAYSAVDKNGALAVANTATNFKKTKLPTAGVYTDGLYVAQPGAKAWKVKASTKIGSTGLALQYIDNDNKLAAEVAEDTQEIDFIVTHKLGDVNLKGIILNRDFDDAVLMMMKFKR